MRLYCDWGSDGFGQFLLSVLWGKSATLEGKEWDRVGRDYWSSVAFKIGKENAGVREILVKSFASFTELNQCHPLQTTYSFVFT